MKDEESLSSTAVTVTTTSAAVKRQSSSDLFSSSSSSSCSSSSNSTATSTGSAAGIFSRSRYKFWALAAILLLAFWSLFTGSVTLKWNNLNNNALSSSDSPSLHDDLDILEVEEREKLVRRLWDVYTHSSTIRLPRFWQEAFEAAYQHLTHEAVGVRNAALSEIAKMSLLSLDLDPPAPSSTRQRSKMEKQTRKEEKTKVTAARTRRL